MIVGIIGGGQLARMLALAGQPLGLEFIFIDPGTGISAASAGQHWQGEYDDPTLLRRLVAAADVATYEFENVPPATIEYLAEHMAVFPSARALDCARDRLHEKSLFARLGIPTVAHRAVNSRADLTEAVAVLGLPAVLKTRRLGYDGKGQAVLRDMADLDAAWQRFHGTDLILEAFVDFGRELSIIAARSRSGDIRFYPLSENVHDRGVLAYSRGQPADARTEEACRYMASLLRELDYVGVLALELFEVGDRLLANEMAPRVHNSGHWTIEGSETSQFENHLRAIVGWPLGNTAPLGHTALFNCVGYLPDPVAVMKIPGAHWHDYRKPVRPGRKVAHITARAADAPGLEAAITALKALLPGHVLG
ncbi:MAG: 5-(carboxyamino)imidazole ribonucleotide synthase [Gammaproteobacteria bacterium]|nr:5-(carboxyamino)imidazole ribonucleotide synthase [Gammaproteobacteria bacterium]